MNFKKPKPNENKEKQTPAQSQPTDTEKNPYRYAWKQIRSGQEPTFPVSDPMSYKCAEVGKTRRKNPTRRGPTIYF